MPFQQIGKNTKSHQSPVKNGFEAGNFASAKDVSPAVLIRPPTVAGV